MEMKMAPTKRHLVPPPNASSETENQQHKHKQSHAKPIAHSKRPAEMDEEVSKKSKMSKVDDQKPPLFTRLFSVADEIVILQGMIDFKLNKGADPSSNLVAFRESVASKLSCSVDKLQLYNKIRKLKKRFLNNMKKGPNATKEKWIRLSIKIWGFDGEGWQVDDGDIKTKDMRDGNVVTKTLSVTKNIVPEEVNDEMEVDMEDCGSLYPYLRASLELEAAAKSFTTSVCPNEFAKEVIRGIETDKARELEQEWKDLHVMELKAYAKRVELISKQAKAIFDMLQP